MIMMAGHLWMNWVAMEERAHRMALAQTEGHWGDMALALMVSQRDEWAQKAALEVNMELTMDMAQMEGHWDGQDPRDHLQMTPLVMPLVQMESHLVGLIQKMLWVQMEGTWQSQILKDNLDLIPQTEKVPYLVWDLMANHLADQIPITHQGLDLVLMEDLLEGRAKVEEMDSGLILASEQMVTLLEGPHRAMILAEEAWVMAQTGDPLQGCRREMSWVQTAYLSGRVPATVPDQDLAPMPSPMAGTTRETASLAGRDRKKNRAAARGPTTWAVSARALTGAHWVATGLGTSSVPMAFPSGGIQPTCKDLVPAAAGGDRTWWIATGGDPTRRIPAEICSTKRGGRRTEAGHLLRATCTVREAGPTQETTFMATATTVRLAERGPKRIQTMGSKGDPCQCMAPMAVPSEERASGELSRWVLRRRTSIPCWS